LTATISRPVRVVLSDRLDAARFARARQHSLARASVVVVDDPQMVQLESADIAETIAAGLLDPARIQALSDWPA